MTHQVQWISFAVFVCLVSFTSAKEARIKLEVIEKENFNNEKPLLAQFPNQPSYGNPSFQNFQPFQQPQQPPPPIHQQQQQFFQNMGPPPQYPPPPPQYPPPSPQTAVSQGSSTGPHLFAPGARMFPPPPPLQLQFPSNIPQQQIAPAAPAHDLLQLFENAMMNPPVGHEHQFQYQFPLEESILQDPYLHQYFAKSAPQQQYIYLEQPQATNQIPVIENIPQNPPSNMGDIQYVQFVDSNTERLRNPQTQIKFLDPQHKSNHNLAGLIQRTAYTNTLPLNYRGPAPQTYRVEGAPLPLVPQNLYVIPPSGSPPPPPANNNYHQQQPNHQTNQVLGQQRFLIPGIIYAQNQPQPQYQNIPFELPPQPQPSQYTLEQQQPQFQLLQYQTEKPAFNEQQQTQQSITDVVYEKREPKSLLDSYVPSVLQIQYYKELQQQHEQQQQQQGQQHQKQQNNNALRSEAKSSESIKGGKDKFVKNFATTKNPLETRF